MNFPCSSSGSASAFGLIAPFSQCCIGSLPGRVTSARNVECRPDSPTYSGLSEPHHKPFEEFLWTLFERAAEEWAQSHKTASDAHARIDQYRREHLLPDTEALEKIQRYKSHLCRQFHRDLTNFNVFKLRAWGIPSPRRLP